VRKSRLGDINICVYVADNDSIDGSVETIEQDFPEVTLIKNTTNVGFSTANNQAIRQIDARYILLLNPDTILSEDTLKLCYDHMEAQADIGALGVRMIDGSGKFLPESKRKVPDLWNSFCKLSYLSDLFPSSKLFSGYNLGHLPEHQTNDIEVLCGAFMFIRTQTLQEVGLLDEAFFMYGEDIDLSYRILKGGYRIVYFPETSIIHFKGESTKKSSMNYIRTFYGAMSIYVNKHYGNNRGNTFARIINIAIYLRAALSAFQAILGQLVLPILDILLGWGLIMMTKNLWAVHYFGNSDYYEKLPIDYILLGYNFLWISGLYLYGHYEDKSKMIDSAKAIFSTTLFMLAVYALLPLEYRSSRMLLIVGSIIVLFLSQFTSYFFKYIKKYFRLTTVDKRNIAIVGSKIACERITQKLSTSKVPHEALYYISTEHELYDSYFTNSVEQLSLITNRLKINEVIYSSDDLSIANIMELMSMLDSKISFKIEASDAMHILGSQSKNTQGEFYAFKVDYDIALPIKIRAKRWLDIVIAILSIIFSPFLLVLCYFNLRLFGNIKDVLLGKKTWVAYGGDKVNYQFLPTLKHGILAAPLQPKYINYSSDHFKIKNIDYAKGYNVWSDLQIIFSNLHQLAN